MSDSKHTPGPWRRMMNTAGGVGLWSIETDAANVARVNFGADADLIAAAPDLLAACEAMLAAHGNCGSPTEQKAADLCAAAIAAARGQK